MRRCRGKRSDSRGLYAWWLVNGFYRRNLARGFDARYDRRRRRSNGRGTWCSWYNLYDLCRTRRCSEYTFCPRDMRSSRGCTTSLDTCGSTFCFGACFGTTCNDWRCNEFRSGFGLCFNNNLFLFQLVRVLLFNGLFNRSVRLDRADVMGMMMMMLVVVMMTLRWGMRSYIRGGIIRMERRGWRRDLCLYHLAQG